MSLRIAGLIEQTKYQAMKGRFPALSGYLRVSPALIFLYLSFVFLCPGFLPEPHPENEAQNTSECAALTPPGRSHPIVRPHQQPQIQTTGVNQQALQNVVVSAQ